MFVTISERFTYGVVSEGVLAEDFAEVLQKMLWKFAKTPFIASGSRNSAEGLRKSQRNSCNDSFPNDPISELLNGYALLSAALISYGPYGHSLGANRSSC